MKKHSVIAFIMVLLLCVSCGSNASVTETTPAAGDTTVSDETAVFTRENTPDSLPDDLDFNGATFTIHHFDLNTAEWIADGENGDVINDAVYRRNRAVEERLNVKLNFYDAGILTDYKTIALNTLRSSILAGSGEFDLIAGYAAYITNGMGGYLTNLYDVKYLDFDKPWWISNMADEMTVNNRMYYMAGDIGMSFMQCFDTCFFNSRMAVDYRLGDLFDSYANGKWTIDEMRRCVVAVTEDVNSNGKIDLEGEDRLGLLLFDKGSGLDGFLGSTRLRVTEKGKSGTPEIIVNSERTVTLIEKLTGLFSEAGADITLMNYYPKGQDDALRLFSSGKLLFFHSWLKVAENEAMRNMKDDWGILPYPKLDENQDSYGVFVCDGYSLFCIPVDCTDIDRAGAVTEALAAESYRHLTESYYSVALQSKYARSEESIRVLDDLRESVYMDFGYNYVGIGASYVVRNIILSNGTLNFASWYAEKKNVIEENLKNELKAYLE